MILLTFKTLDLQTLRRVWTKVNSDKSFQSILNLVVCQLQGCGDAQKFIATNVGKLLVIKKLLS